MYYTFLLFGTHIKIISFIPETLHIISLIEYSLVMVCTHEIAF